MNAMGHRSLARLPDWQLTRAERRLAPSIGYGSIPFTELDGTASLQRGYMQDSRKADTRLASINFALNPL
jgi:hypothetical protein